jgi:hypothetical protein
MGIFSGLRIKLIESMSPPFVMLAGLSSSYNGSSIFAYSVL